MDFPTISLQIDQNYNYDVVNAYYDRIFDGIHDLIDSTDSLKDCIINYVTSTQKIEVIDANIKSTQNMKNFDFINCTITDGIFDSCNFINTQINNCQIIKSKLHGCDITKTKVINCQVEASELKDCFFMNGYLNGDMYGGVFRSGKLGPYANISSDTKIVTDSENFFDTSFEDDRYDAKKDQGVIKAFKK